MRHAPQWLSTPIVWCIIMLVETKRRTINKTTMERLLTHVMIGHLGDLSEWNADYVPPMKYAALPFRTL